MYQDDIATIRSETMNMTKQLQVTPVFLKNYLVMYVSLREQSTIG